MASGLLSLTRTVGQTTDIAQLGAFWERRISALTGGMHFENITLAPITAQVGGLIDTILLVIAIVSVSLCLSLWALSVWLRDRKRLALKAEMID